MGPLYLPEDPVETMHSGNAHRVPLIVGTNADEGRLFTRFLELLPTNEQAIERLLAHVEPDARERILAAYPEYPHPDACVRFGGDFIFGSGVADRPGPLGACPDSCVPLRLRDTGAAGLA